MAEVRARWGQIVLIVADDLDEAWAYKRKREDDPEDHYIYRVVQQKVEIMGLTTPDIARIDEIGRWKDHYDNRFVHEVNRVKAELHGRRKVQQERRREEGRVQREVRQKRGGG